MNILPLEDQINIANALVEGNSIRATSRLVGVEHKTVMRVLLRVGDACGQLLNERVRRIRAKHVQVDEIWTYVFKKQKNLGMADDEATMGDQYVFVAMDSQTKLVISHLVGKRDYPTAFNLISDLKDRLAHRIQLTTDGFKPYINAVEDNFGADIDYGVLVKMYGGDSTESAGPAWYGPAKVMAAMPTRVSGNPDWKHISTSHIETAEPHHENADAAIYPVDERGLEEAGKPQGPGRLALRTLQLLPRALQLARHARDGSGAQLHALDAPRSADGELAV